MYVNKFIVQIKHTLRPPSEYSLFCIIRRIVGTLFPLASYEHCIDFADTPKTLALYNKRIVCQTSQIRW
jgi:hypothetical protein